MFHHHWWTYLIVAFVAGYFTVFFDLIRHTSLEADDYGEDEKDKFKGKR